MRCTKYAPPPSTATAIEQHVIPIAIVLLAYIELHRLYHCYEYSSYSYAKYNTVYCFWPTHCIAPFNLL